MTDPEIRYRLLAAFDPALETFTFPALVPFFRRLGEEAADAGETPFAFAAYAGQRPAGLLLGGMQRDESPVCEIRSVYVTPLLRRKGYGETLWAMAEDWSKARGARRIRVNYVTGKPSIHAIERILEKRGWSPPAMRMLVVKTRMDLAVRAPWFREWKLPDGYEILSWDELKEDDVRELRDSQVREGWIPQDLVPFDFLKDRHRETSLALRRDGRVRGWLINHLIGNTVRFTCSFVHPDLQRKGRVFCLYSEAMRRMTENGLRFGMWTVPVEHPAMQAFARRWMKPYSLSFRESRESYRDF